jgi:hypothetical protein
MTPPSNTWRQWLYAVAWLGGGVAASLFAIWLVTLIRWDWPADRAEQQLTILGNALYGMIGVMALVTIGLTMRNAIRNLKLAVGSASGEAQGHDE